MKTSRLIALPSLVAALALVGCPATPPSTTAPPSPSATDGAMPVGSPTPAPTETPATVATPSSSPTPSASPTGGASATPTPAATEGLPAGTETGILKGRVLDGTGAAVPDGTKVDIMSLDKSVPYTASTTTADGNYVFNAVPYNVQVSVTANRTGWTRRTRVMVARPFDPRLGDRNVFNFGGSASDVDRSAPSYYLSPYPEIETISPTDQDASLPNDKMAFKLTLSEPLDAANRRRLAAAITLVPNSVEAVSTSTSLPASVADIAELDGLRIGSPPVAPATGTWPNFPYAYRQNSAFLGGLKTGSFTWDEEGRVATFVLEAPVKTDSQNEAEYAFFLVQRDKDKIVDSEGKALGMDKDNVFGGTTIGLPIYNAIREPSVNLNENFTNEKTRWADTHLSYSRFRVLSDKVLPKLLSVLARRDFVDDAGTTVDRLELTFSEPMMAYPRITSPGLVSLNNYVFTAAGTEALLAERKLADDGTAEAVTTAASATDLRDKITQATAVRLSSNASSSGNYKVAVSVYDPKVVILSLPGGSLPLDANFVKVFVGGDRTANESASESVTDPAGNGVEPASATTVGPIL